VVVEVTDDGIGFEPAAVHWGSGVTTMEQFTQLAGGRLRVSSAPGQGTSVRAELGRHRKPIRRRHLRAVD
jgi:two-component system sensor histidine kinase NreB